jgi:uncharacterized protein (DUF58 family)
MMSAITDETRQYLIDGERAGLRYAISLPRQTLLGQSGTSISNRAGSSLEFRDYRDYQAGDDLRHVDWSAYARSDQLSIKLYREEITPHADILVDDSRSMALEGSAKARATLGLAGFFAAAANNAGYTLQAWRVATEVEPVVNGTASPAEWQDLSLQHRGTPGEAFARVGPRLKPRGLRLFLSDLLWEGEPLNVLRHLTDRASTTVVVQVLAVADDQPALGGNVRLVDVETEQIREIHVDEAALRRYRESLRRHQDNWHRACKQTGALFTVVIAEKLLESWRLDDLVAAEVLKVV